MTKASLPSSGRGLQTSAHLYFTISIIIIVGCSICFNILDKLPVMRYHRNRRIPPSEHNSSSSKDPEASTDLSTSSSTAHPRFWDVWRAIQWSACGVGVLYIVTLSIFPGFITEDVRSLLLKDWYPISLIAAYNLFDLAGKTLTAVYVPKGAKWIIWGCFGRLLFYPLFAACLHGPRLFRTEIPVTALTCALGLTNGYLTSVLMILAPKSVPILESEVAGTVMMLFLGIGLAGGSILGWFWVI